MLPQPGRCRLGFVSTLTYRPSSPRPDSVRCMQNRATTSWRRSSDEVRLMETQRLTVPEDERPKIAAPTSRARVMVVDNDMGSADTLETMLHALGFPETRVAYSGHAALAIADEFKPGLVMVELDLLDMDGYELATRLRERARSWEPKLIALTTSREHPEREQARSAGFERYLLKPVVAIDLSKVLELPSR
jgi:CheY-like chemotaxis protein